MLSPAYSVCGLLWVLKEYVSTDRIEKAASYCGHFEIQPFIVTLILEE